MSDILVTSPFQPFTLPTQFKAVFNGYIYCGTVDAVDPSVSQVQVYLVNEAGDKVPVAQPLRTNAGGYLVYNGQPAKFVTDSNHSLLVQDQQQGQVWYVPDMANVDPDNVVGEVFDILIESDGSSKIGFIQAGTGAVPRTAQDKMREFVSVTDFGAIGDGVTNDTAAFNAASAVSPLGVYVPMGTHLIPADITGKFFGPGRRISAIGNDPIPFANPAQSHGTVFVGYDAGKTYSGNQITGQVVGVGPGAGRNVTTGTNITAVGAGTLTGDTLVDALTDTSPCTGTELIALGVNALKKAVTLDNSIGIGRDALNENKFGSFNVAIGSSALQQLHTGSNNVAIGRAAGMRAGMITDPAGIRLSFNVVNGCTFLGNGAGREITSGDNNTYIGNGAGRGVTSVTNSFTGTATGDSNVAVGAEALNEIGTSSRNVTIGFRAGRTLNAGNGNIFIGYSAGSGVVSGDNKLIVANQGSLPFLEGLMGPVADVNNYARFDASVQPASDNLRACGSSSRRWSVVFAGNGTINTSDAREKTAPMPITDAVLDAWGDVQLVTFKWLDAIQKKSEDLARWHFGVIAQQVRDAFIAHGLDGCYYGLLCYDEWGDEFQPVMGQRENPETGELEEYPTGEQEILIAAGNRWGIRPDQCLFLEAAYQRRRCDRIEARLTAIGA